MDRLNLIERIARATHEVNRTYCQQLGDDSHLPWDEAPDWQRDSARKGVAAIIDGTTTTPKEQHDSWMRQKAAEGWVYGDVKDPEKKMHPCIVPYDLLPPEQQAKDSLFRATVMGLLPADMSIAGLARKDTEAKGWLRGGHPSIGRIVHYTNLGDKDGRFPPEVQAAIVTKVHDPVSDGVVSLKIFYPTGLFDMSRVDYTDETPGTNAARGKWTWPTHV